MKRYKIIFLIGLWVIVIPFLGVPLMIKKILLVIPGAFLILIGILMSQEQETETEQETGISYAEAMPAVGDEEEVQSDEYQEESPRIVTNPQEFKRFSGSHSSEKDRSDSDE